MVDKSFMELGVDLFKAIAHKAALKIPVINAELSSGYQNATFNGDKFYGGFGITKDYRIIDHYILRKRSKQLFTENLYARGLIRRLVTNVINKGLNLEATPESSILGIDQETLMDWSENIERRFKIYCNSPVICDYNKRSTLGAIQRQAETMALVSGDVLIVLRQGKSKLPSIQLIDAEKVSNPLSDTMITAILNRGNQLVDGVEINQAGEHVAFFVEQKSGIHKRVTAKGLRTGRKQAWLYYSNDRLLDDVRGQSILALMLQSFKEIDRYRDSEQRSAVINSTIALWVEKTQDKMSSLSIGGSAVRADLLESQNDSQGRKDIEFSSLMPGMMLQELQHGEKPTSYDTKRPNVNFAIFETAIINTIAWANEMPPEILQLAFHQNYAASRGAVVEFKMFLDKKRTMFGEQFLDPIYTEYLISETLNQDIKADGFLDSWRDLSKWDVFGAWVQADWSGAIKPNTDMLKDAKAYKMLISENLITRDRASRELTGMKFSKIVQTSLRENEEVVKAKQPLIDAGLISIADEIESPEVNTQ